jgi:hypothetical protein
VAGINQLKNGERRGKTTLCQTEYHEVGLSRMWGNHEVLLEHKIYGGGDSSYVFV